MPNYNEQQARDNPGTTYRRTRYIGIRNQPDGTVSVEVLEADAIFIDGKKRHLDEGAGTMTTSFRVDDPEALGASFPLVDPATDAVIPGQSATVGQLMLFLYSWNAKQRQLRDAVN